MWVLIAPVPGLCILVTFTQIVSQNRTENLLCLPREINLSIKQFSGLRLKSTQYSGCLVSNSIQD